MNSSTLLCSYWIVSFIILYQKYVHVFIKSRTKGNSLKTKRKQFICLCRNLQWCHKYCFAHYDHRHISPDWVSQGPAITWHKAKEWIMWELTCCICTLWYRPGRADAPVIDKYPYSNTHISSCLAVFIYPNNTTLILFEWELNWYFLTVTCQDHAHA